MLWSSHIMKKGETKVENTPTEAGCKTVTLQLEKRPHFGQAGFNRINENSKLPLVSHTEPAFKQQHPLSVSYKFLQQLCPDRSAAIHPVMLVTMDTSPFVNKARLCQRSVGWSVREV